MCSVFGLIDYQNSLTVKQKNKLVNVLARECEVRGTDATGIAYNRGNKLCIYKRALPAHRLKLRIPPEVSVVLGHTRMTTQGHAKFHQNNHPFRGKLPNGQFALAHNGVLWNDELLSIEQQLPKTDIATDSYVAVQMLEKQKALDFFALRSVAEKVEGTFVFTVLDMENSIWFIKGNNPLYFFRYDGFLMYASTKEILEKTRKKLRIGKPREIIEPKDGQLIHVNPNGTFSQDTFDMQERLPHYYYPYSPYKPYLTDDAGFDELVDIAKCMGVSESEVGVLLDYGCTPDEIEELLYDPTLLHDLTEELLYAY